MFAGWRRFLLTSLMITLLFTAGISAAPCPGRNQVSVRGRLVDIYYYPATGTRLNRKVLFAPGDGGWRGWAVTVAQYMSSWGYDVYGIDTRDYLSEFTRGGTGLMENEVMSDFREIAGWAGGGYNEKVTLMGWSAGAGLAVLAAAAPANRRVFNGLIVFGLGDENILGWTWQDTLVSFANRGPSEPTFRTSAWMSHIAPVPLYVIQASRDTSVPTSEARGLFSLAREPRCFVLVEAGDHKFTGGQQAFFRALSEGLQWIR